nr:restriction endonuclease subunit R [Chloroflexota bacterium]
MSLEQSLLLNRYLHRQLGADSLEELGNELAGVPEGADADGRSFFAKRLLSGTHRYADTDAFERYDARIIEIEGRLAHARGGFSLKYFQYLALLYTELYLDALTADPEALAASLNAFRTDDPAFADLADTRASDLRRMAYFMATGSGKTLLMHATLWQVQH